MQKQLDTTQWKAFCYSWNPSSLGTVFVNNSAAMGLEEFVQIAPKQISLKELSAKRAQVEKRQEDTAKRIIDTHKRNWSLSRKSIRTCQWRNARSRQSWHSEPLISRNLMQRSTSPQSLRPWRSGSLFLKTLQRTRRISGRKNLAEADAAKRAPREPATHSTTKRRCTTKTQPPEEVDVEPPDPTQSPSQASQVEKLAPPDIKNLIAHAHSTAVLAKEAARSFGPSFWTTPLSRHTNPVRAMTSTLIIYVLFVGNSLNSQQPGHLPDRPRAPLEEQPIWLAPILRIASSLGVLRC